MNMTCLLLRSTTRTRVGDDPFWSTAIIGLGGARRALGHMAELRIVSPDKPTDAVADIIFVHGLGGDQRSTWQASKAEESFWPAWLAQDSPHIAVYSLGYEASPSAWLGSAMPLSDRATNVLASLEAEQLGERPLIWVCHSLGGLVVKQLLRTAATLGHAS